MIRTDHVRFRAALRIALTYAIISAVWILVSDRIVLGLGNPRLVRVLSTGKGWFFVLVTAILLYSLVSRTIAQVTTAEAQTRLIFDSLNDSVYIFYLPDSQPPGCIITVNDHAIRTLGYTRAEFERRTPWDLVKPELLPTMNDALTTLKSAGSVIFETVQVAKDGREIPVEMSSRIIHVEDRTIGVAIARDISVRLREVAERRDAELAAERDKRRFYRETILAVTGGKFELGDIEEAGDWVKDAAFSLYISGPEELADARTQLMAYCRAEGLSDEYMADFELAIGEALGNAVKHAGGGWAYAGHRDDVVWVGIVDHGTGIDTFAIPRVALLPGFSTKASMGLGYTMILNVTDHVKLATGPTGTTVVMEKDLHPLSDLDRRLAVHSGIV